MRISSRGDTSVRTRALLPVPAANFRSSFLLTPLGRRQRSAQVLRFLPPIWETTKEFCPTSWLLSNPVLTLGPDGEGTRRWKISLLLFVALSNKYSRLSENRDPEKSNHLAKVTPINFTKSLLVLPGVRSQNSNRAPSGSHQECGLWTPTLEPPHQNPHVSKETRGTPERPTQ